MNTKRLNLNPPWSGKASDSLILAQMMLDQTKQRSNTLIEVKNNLIIFRNDPFEKEIKLPLELDIVLKRRFLSKNISQRLPENLIPFNSGLWNKFKIGINKQVLKR